jgi:hypothetical protein
MLSVPLFSGFNALSQSVSVVSMVYSATGVGLQELVCGEANFNDWCKFNELVESETINAIAALLPIGHRRIGLSTPNAIELKGVPYRYRKRLCSSMFYKIQTHDLNAGKLHLTCDDLIVMSCDVGDPDLDRKMAKVIEERLAE